ncbi:hypothetical protein [Streptomyces sp. NPDC059168]|uniref:hypothetical protein n=1 Tax=Streptomyces sp. NPDC059168 TaxID=3346753 RepID=UPI0036C402B2
MSLGSVLLGVVCVSVALVSSAMVGLVAGWLARLDQASWPGAVARAGVAFGATLTLIGVVVTTVASVTALG